MGGYPTRGNPVLGIVDQSWSSGTPDLTLNNNTYTSLHYGNGPGFFNLTQTRLANLTAETTSKDDYLQESAVPMGQETHGGEGT
jgi:alkaline phosphatase